MKPASEWGSAKDSGGVQRGIIFPSLMKYNSMNCVWNVFILKTYFPCQWIIKRGEKNQAHGPKNMTDRSIGNVRDSFLWLVTVRAAHINSTFVSLATAESHALSFTKRWGSGKMEAVFQAAVSQAKCGSLQQGQRAAGFRTGSEKKTWGHGVPRKDATGGHESS